MSFYAYSENLKIIYLLSSDLYSLIKESIILIYLIAAVLAAAAIFEGIALLSLIKQLRSIKENLDFIRENKTNMRLTSNTPSKAANELIDSINSMIDKTDSIRISCGNESDSLKDSLAGISHDIRTPLTSLSGYFRLLEASDSEAEKQRYYKIIDARIKDLNVMLEQLFTYTKLQNSSYELEVSKTDLTACVIDTLLEFYALFGEKNIEPQITADEAPVYIYGNEDALHRIFRNIIKNAVEHGTGELSVYFGRENKEAVFRCSNKCSDPENIDISGVFTKFYKTDPARSDTSTGLGLTIAKELAQRQGGSVEASLNGYVFCIEVRFELLMNN